ncbi:hypothetical protein BEL04_13950 [Mucilaginibacter sp. PPCGB 2223]|uniref:hypothetical protein n=1 Tax=Mucilaginibacter sp. PPCGB 2223 TaxID=1886027 RepID=UPI00082580D2|nr:hypothetical protein [Mucilaginibacter sp. PPCGB 2223]OCX52551.1 hypothetical protein BEL04_13950 [Mucilaginibacter sp. PPCGB 2223]
MYAKPKAKSNRPDVADTAATAQRKGISMPAVPVSQEDNIQRRAVDGEEQVQDSVKPTMQMKDAVPVNGDTWPEHEADITGAKAVTGAATANQLKTGPVSTTAPVAQLAGTKPNQPTVDGRYRVKLSSVREEFTYRNRLALGLNDVLPGHHRIRGKKYTESGKIEAVMLDGEHEWLFLKQPIDAPSGDQKVLCIDTVGWEDESAKPERERDQKCVMDVKMGTYTKSSEQFALEGAGVFKRFFKKIEHNLKDLNRDSRKLGYDIDAANLAIFLNLATNRATSRKLQAAMIELRPKLMMLRERMDAAPITFVGSSLFMVFNLTSPEKSDVRLIDPDHPIVIDPGELQLPDQLVRRSTFEGQRRSWDDYITKWKGGFDTGMRNFMRWFDNLAIGGS